MKQRSIHGLALVFLIVTLTLSACAATPTATPVVVPEQRELAPTQAAEPTQVQAEVVDPASWQADGVISSGEYAHQETFGQVTLAWRNDADYLYLAMQSPTMGWVSVGLDPDNRMQGANYLLGWVEDGKPQLWDAYGQGPVGATHPPDSEIGGTDDIVLFGGAQDAQGTTIEFQIPLDSGDAYDKLLESGQSYTVLVAHADEDEFDARHSFRGSGTITLD